MEHRIDRDKTVLNVKETLRTIKQAGVIAAFEQEFASELSYLIFAIQSGKSDQEIIELAYNYTLEEYLVEREAEVETSHAL